MIEYPKVWIETMSWVGNAAMVESRMLENPSFQIQIVRMINKEKKPGNPLNT